MDRWWLFTYDGCGFRCWTIADILRHEYQRCRLFFDLRFQFLSWTHLISFQLLRTFNDFDPSFFDKLNLLLFFFDFFHLNLVDFLQPLILNFDYGLDSKLFYKIFLRWSLDRSHHYELFFCGLFKLQNLRFSCFLYFFNLNRTF